MTSSHYLTLPAASARRDGFRQRLHDDVVVVASGAVVVDHFRCEVAAVHVVAAVRLEFSEVDENLDERSGKYFLLSQWLKLCDFLHRLQFERAQANNTRSYS